MLTLIQLVSEQPMPNLLAILAFRPSRVVHLCTPRALPHSDHLLAAAAQEGEEPLREILPMTAMPGIAESLAITERAIRDAHAASEDVVLHFTGGTKLMSIGAFAAALRSKVPSVYVDTDAGLFVDGTTASPSAIEQYLAGDPSILGPARRFHVHSIAVAHGRERVTNGADFRPLLPLARLLAADPALEQASHEALVGPAGLFPRGIEPNRPADWLPFFDRPLALPPAVATAAIAASLLEGPADAPRLPQAPRAEMEHLAATRVPDYPARYFPAVAPLQRAHAILAGGWWEIIVADAVTASGHFRDVRWSAHAGQRGGFNAEEDVLAVRGARLAAFSCKRGGGGKARLVPHLAEFAARAEALGGRFALRYLALARPPRDRAARTLSEEAARYHVRLLTPESLASADPFGP